MTDKPEDDVWIDILIHSSGHDPRFMGMASLSHPYGLNGPAVGTSKFNLTAYIKHLIANQER